MNNICCLTLDCLMLDVRRKQERERETDRKTDRERERVSTVDLSCVTGPRQQLNQITSYLDASNVYGSTREEADELRDFTNTS